MSKTEYSVTLMVPVNNMDEWSAVNEKVDKIDATWHSAGTGYGYRDHEWAMKTKKSALELGNKLMHAFEHINGSCVQVTNGSRLLLKLGELQDVDV